MRNIVAAAVLLAAAGPADAQDFQWPVSGSYEQGFYDTFSGKGAGYYYDHNNVLQYFQGYSVTGTRIHRAIDIGVVTGTPVKAARDGTAYQYSDSSYGNFVIVAHSNGYYTLYAHLSSYATSWGESVGVGQVVGYSGATGFVTGPHLHFEIRHSGSTAYGAYAHYVPGSNIGAGNDIPFDYPDIGPIAGGSAPAGPTGLYASAQSSSSIYFQWNASGGAEGYWLDIANSQSDLVNMVGSFQNHFNGTSTSFTWGGLSSGTTYYWRVWAYNGYGGNHGYPAGPVSTPSSVSPPPAPAIYSPANGATLTSSSVWLDWSTVSGIDYYYYGVYQNGSLVTQGWPTASNATVTLGNGSYTFSVWAHNSAGYGNGSTIGFTVSVGGGSVPGTPGGLTPNNWVSVAGAYVTLDWWNVSGATSYEVYVLYWNGSAWVYYGTFTVGASYLNLWPVVHYKYIAWHVRAKNSAGAGAWSDWAYFYYNN